MKLLNELFYKLFSNMRSKKNKVTYGFLGNQNGQVLILVLVMGSLLASAIYFFADRILINSRQFSQNASDAKAQMVLNSVLDYASFTVKQRWCLTGNMLFDTNCKWAHEKNIERLILSAEQENYLKALETAGTLGQVLPVPLRIDEISLRVSIKEFTNDHPLTPIIGQLYSDDLVGFEIKYTRDHSVNTPIVGQGVFLYIEVSMISKSGGPLLLGKNKLTAKNYLSLHPREISTFALFAPKDLRLDGKQDTNVITFPVIDVQPTDQASVSKSAFVFESPVYVENDIYLLPASDQSVKKMAPVVFADRVVQGIGKVKSGESDYVPPVDQFLWSQSKVFGGFLGGLETDGAKDLGSSYFLGEGEGGSEDNFSQMKDCMDLSKKRNSTDGILNSKLLIDHIKSVDEALGKKEISNEYQLGFDDYNEFVPQSSGSYNKIIVDDNSDSLPFDKDYVKDVIKEIEIENKSVDLKGEGPILEVASYFGKKIVKFYLPFEGSAEFEVKNNIPNEGNALIRFTTQPVIINGKKQPHLVNLKIDIKNPEYLKYTYPEDKNANPIKYLSGEEIQFYSKIKAFDKLFKNGQPIVFSEEDDGWFGVFNPLGGDDDEKQKKWNKHVTYLSRADAAKKDGDYLIWSKGMIKSSEIDNFFKDEAVSLYDDTITQNDLATLIEKCSNQGNGVGASWGDSFAPQARHSWNFAAGKSEVPYQDPLINELIFDDKNSTPSTTDFRVYSIVKNCIIKPSASVVTGFFSCDHLQIEARTTPLRIIGTFIVGSLNVDKSVYNQGVRWSNIYHPQAVEELKAMNVLKPKTKNKTCAEIEDAVTGVPVWHPKPSLIDAQDRILCSPVSLRAKADPFQWTSLDPDCGVPTGGSTTTCKRRMNKVLLIEHSREFGQ